MKKVCFTASSGGHFEQLTMLNPLIKKYQSFVITEKTNYEINLKEQIYYVDQINRHEKSFLFKFIKLFIKSLKIYLKEKPDVIISLGALSTFPICIVGKIFGKKVIFIESFAKVTSPTLTGKLVYKFADLFVVQWEDLKKIYPKSTYGGGIY